MSDFGPSTTAVHGGDDLVGARPPGMATPIVQSTTFELDEEAYADIERTGGENIWWYSRLGNPTVASVAAKVAALEGSEAALLFASGNAAVSTTMLALVRPGDRIVAARSLYGDTHTILTAELRALGCDVVLVDVGDRSAWELELARPARLVWLETLSNPMLRVADLPLVAALAQAAGATSVVDSTFATPYNVRPLEHGIDVVVHSATKYLNGHSDLMAGAVAGSAGALAPIRRRAVTLGGCLDPHAAFLLERGLKTLAVRMERHNENALAIARRLSGHLEVEHVSHPFLDSHPDVELARRLLRGGSGLVTVRLRGGDERASRFLSALRLIKEATSLGGVESLASTPYNTSHLSLTGEERRAVGILPGTVRLSLGIEDEADLVADLEQALAGSAS